MEGRQRTPWLRRDAVAVAGAVLSVAAVVFLFQTHEIPRGVREGVAFLLIIVFVGAVVVLLVRHVPLTMLQLGAPFTLLVGGMVLALLSDAPTRYVAIGAGLLGVANLVLRLRRVRRRNRSDRPVSEFSLLRSVSGAGS